MKNRPLIDLLCIFALYAVYWALIYLATDYNLPTDTMGVVPMSSMTIEQFIDDFNHWSLIVMGASLFSVVAWYILGEWGLRSHRTSSGTWLLIWLCLLAVVLAAGFCAALNMGPKASDKGYILAIFYLGGGAVFYWLATVCFSPIAIKTYPPGAVIRRW